MVHAVTSVRLLYPGESDVCCGVHQEEHVTLDLSKTAIATLYGMREDSLRICHRSVYLPFVDGRVVVPSFVVETYNCLARWNGVLECHVDGETDVGMGYCPDADESSDHSDSSGQYDDVMAKFGQFKHTVYEHSGMQERYNFLRFNMKPRRLAGPQEVKEWRNFRRECRRRYELDKDNNLLCRRNMDRPYAKLQARQAAKMYPTRIVVPTRAAMAEIILQRHKHHHDRRDRIVMGLKSHFKYRNLAEVVATVLDDCHRCAEHVVGIPKTVQAIITSRKLQLVMFDLFSMPMKSSKGELHVLLIKDHFTKFHWGKAFPTKDMGPIAAFMVELFRVWGVPERFHCDNGTEFLNKCMDLAIEMMNQPGFSQGRARHPQTQGVIERANKTVKRKVMMKCQDKGYVTHGQDIDWVSDILRSTIDNENNACVVMYDGWTPFEMFHGRPMMAGFVVPPTAQDNADMYERMHQCQLARAYKLNMFPEYEPLLVGTVVNVRATKKEIKDNMALSEWSARGVIHDIHPVSANVMQVRWLSDGLSSNRRRGRKGDDARSGRQSGDLSRYYTRGVFKAVPNAPPAVVHSTQDGHVLITEVLPDGDCNYVFLDDEWKGNMYACPLDTFSSAESISYSEYTLGPERHARAHSGENEREVYGATDDEGNDDEEGALERTAFKQRQAEPRSEGAPEEGLQRRDSDTITTVQRMLYNFKSPDKKKRKQTKTDEEQDCAAQPPVKRQKKRAPVDPNNQKKRATGVEPSAKAKEHKKRKTKEHKKQKPKEHKKRATGAFKARDSDSEATRKLKASIRSTRARLKKLRAAQLSEGEDSKGKPVGKQKAYTTQESESEDTQRLKASIRETERETEEIKNKRREKLGTGEAKAKKQGRSKVCDP